MRGIIVFLCEQTMGGIVEEIYARTMHEAKRIEADLLLMIDDNEFFVEIGYGEWKRD
jgi:hypothetical protein